MSGSRVRPVRERGDYSISSVSVGAGATLTVSIPLSRADFTHGFLHAYIPDSVSEAKHKRILSVQYVTDTESEGFAESTRIDSFNFKGYTGAPYEHVNHRASGFAQDVDGRLSDNNWAHTTTNSVIFGGSRINGTDLEIKLTNTGGSGATVSMEFRFIVEKVIRV